MLAGQEYASTVSMHMCTIKREGTFNATIVIMESYEDIAKLSATELADFLLVKLEGEIEFPDIITSKFKDNKITGQLFLALTHEELKELIPIIGDRRAVKSVIDSFQEPNDTAPTVRIHACMQ